MHQYFEDEVHIFIVISLIFIHISYFVKIFPINVKYLKYDLKMTFTVDVERKPDGYCDVDLHLPSCVCPCVNKCVCVRRRKRRRQGKE